MKAVKQEFQKVDTVSESSGTLVREYFILTKTRELKQNPLGYQLRIRELDRNK